ncbi:hypothetical protein [Variovorax sp.]|uniref:hypothetical protein n=1 Tax=Variovorax sp. TaxID=1871043 RepID=UPI002D760690|nr:hypothetical protein [Variovorax sp.]HYP81920.1 hypothetical protein [Variovorax sp.]
MHNDLPAQYLDAELDRNAYNAAFNELGLRWHWCGDVYGQLLRERSDAGARIRLYLERHQPHLLRAYDADFLSAVIEEKAAAHKRRLGGTGAMVSPAWFDWAETLGREIGV